MKEIYSATCSNTDISGDIMLHEIRQTQKQLCVKSGEVTKQKQKQTVVTTRIRSERSGSKDMKFLLSRMNGSSVRKFNSRCPIGGTVSLTRHSPGVCSSRYCHRRR